MEIHSTPTYSGLNPRARIGGLIRSKLIPLEEVWKSACPSS